MKDSSEFIADFYVEGMLHALVIRSPVARGILKEIVHPKLPDSFHLISAEYIPGENRLADFATPVLADKTLSYIGEPVAILAGPGGAALEEIASQIRVNAEEEPPLFFSRDTSPADTGPENILVKRDITHGDLPASAPQGGKSFSGTYTTGRQDHWYPEPHGAAAIPSSARHPSNDGTKNSVKTGRGKKAAETLNIYTATQWPYHVKRSVAGVLGWETEKITVTPTVMTPHLDGKLWYPSLVACHAALAAFITGSPVKLMLTKEEDFLYSPKRNASKIEIHTGVGEKGEILGTSVLVNLDLGSSGIFEDEIIDHTCLGTLGLYHHQAVKIEGAGIRTNIPPQGPMAGFGLSQGFFAAERQVSRIADALGQDPAEWRKKNFLLKNHGFALGKVLKDHVPLPELIDAAASMSDYYRKWVSYELLRTRRRSEKWEFTGEPLRGIGISTACQGNGFLYNGEGANYGVELTLEKDGFLEIKTSLLSLGSIYADTGSVDIWRDLAFKILGVEPSFVRLTADTGNAPDSGPAALSRNIGFVTKLVERCCLAIRKQRFRDPLPITVKRSVKPGKSPGWVPGKNADPEAFAHPSWGAAVAEIEIDPVTLSPGIRGIWLAVDGGKILSQRRARRTLTTGINHALGWTCRERVYYRKGKIDPTFFRGFHIPAPAEIPPISVDFIWNDAASPKGIGDLPFNCVPAAYVQAVSQAMDHPFENIPLDVREIWEALKSKQTESPQ